MSTDRQLLELLDKQEIRELALLYCRGVDRKDPTLLRSLYTDDAIDNHGDVFRGSAEKYVDFLESSFPFIEIGAHYLCNHLIEIDPQDPDQASGEAYALGYHLIPGPNGSRTDSLVGVRYLDRYQRDAGRWRFAQRDVIFDLDRSGIVDQHGTASAEPTGDPSYELLPGALFRRTTT